MRKEGDSNPRYEKFVRQFSKLLVSATHPSFQSSLPNRQALSLKCGCKVSHLFSSRQIYRNLFSKNLSLCSFLLIYFALSALFSSKSHHPPLSSQGHEATQAPSAARAREGLPKCAFLFHHEVAKFSPRGNAFSLSEQAQREADEDEREGGYRSNQDHTLSKVTASEFHGRDIHQMVDDGIDGEAGRRMDL